MRKLVPRAGLLGSLTAIALVIISFLPLVDIAAQPIVGFTSLAIILATFTRTAGSFPASFRGVGRGSVGLPDLLRFVRPGSRTGAGSRRRPSVHAATGGLATAGWPVLGLVDRVLGARRSNYLPVAIPLALATVVGGIDCTESAAAAGDDYPTGQIIAAEGLATVVGGLFGE